MLESFQYIIYQSNQINENSQISSQKMESEGEFISDQIESQVSAVLQESLKCNSDQKERKEIYLYEVLSFATKETTSEKSN